MTQYSLFDDNLEGRDFSKPPAPEAEEAAPSHPVPAGEPTPDAEEDKATRMARLREPTASPSWRCVLPNPRV